MSYPFDENAGRFMSRKESRTMRDAHRKEQIDCGLKETEFTQSEFFGAKKLAELLRTPDCVGIRVHYAKRWENADDKPTEAGVGRLKPRVLLTAVDAKGRDILTANGMKDDGDDDDTNGGLGDGPVCPRHCAG